VPAAPRLQEARFPAVKTLEEFDFQVVPHISVAVMRNLSEGGYLTRKEPVTARHAGYRYPQGLGQGR
jgi:hypothetical protein